MASTTRGPSTRVLFDYSKPEFTGYLYKQGGIHKAFKKRYFILYPGYLVYYSDEAKYRADVAKSTLQGRLHAVRIKGGECHHTKESKDAPRGCKFGFSITAPDPINRRSHYLLNAASKEERRAWIAAIKHCCSTTSPRSSPTQPRRDQESSTVAVSSATNAQASEEAIGRPASTEARPVSAQLSNGHSSDSSGIDTPEMSRKTNYPTPRRETGFQAALVQTRSGDSDSDEANFSNTACADSDDDIGPEPEITSMLSHSAAARKPSTPSPVELVVTVKANGQATDAQIADVKADAVPNGVLNDKNDTSGPLPNGDVKNSSNSESESKRITLPSDSTTSEMSDDTLPLGSEKSRSNSGSSSMSNEDEDYLNLPQPKPEVTETRKKPKPLISQKSLSTTDLLSPDHKKEPSPLAAASPDPAPVESPVTEKLSKSASSSALQSLASPPKEPVRRVSAPFLQKTGYLYKRGGKRPTWKNRFFVLTPGNFTYYTDELHRNKPIRDVKLKNTSVHIPGPGESKDQTYQFTVHTESQWNKRANYIFAAQSEYEMNEWVKAFKAAGQKVVMNPSAATAKEQVYLNSSH